ncbi:MAG: HNH endonuclease signature motif containing protein [Anaerolineae bacterium]
MPFSAEMRAAVREAYGRRCGYCGVSEVWVGGELEIDHFRPLRHAGGDDFDNLVYACTICNRFKSDYWPADDAPDNLRLLHPFKDDLSTHLLQTSDGRLVGLTPRGWFHIDRLRLNRPLLVELRRIRHAEQLLRQELDQAQTINAQMLKRIWALEIELAELRELIARLSA